ncbi:bifunctional UDP-N-acetylglucosamine diphosphorylase/glucosamine-1-phosphate N-acetyltransferase GlmU [Acidipila sp. EB88]|uniref:bifunctional UDP-N-acetylglucosamine diphosphorylase/glucosamine-1-phosphate N-acetyltransferase GlmU n=1 Tax=Acidipila sp. EB88 TaxID=2305226 RepID=UPI000F5FDCF1|nr:bifunctional UDP-N-acetylglucosamine diphosphorylase/glucosamine-1-phosphate N-acetyltransferase GlmU [Acidipila sp. EB88]RRA47415.1 UDP-N-acetylglucosamine diphosphorylase/glucosamine-1-phosphate N-acetyltransferase [Acidipila sp. EB88]
MVLAIVILAAGKGTRLRSSRPKVLHSIGGKPLLLHVIDAALQVVPSSDIFVITGHQSETVQAAVAHTGVHFIEQAEQRGTGHAIQLAIPALRDYEHVLVLSGDVPLLRTETVSALRDFHLRQRAAMTILSAEVEKPFGYGRIVRTTANGPEVSRIVEQRDLAPEDQPIREINSGIYAFALDPLRAHIDRLEANNAQGELYLTDVAALMGKAGERVLALEAPSASEILGANTIAEIMELDAHLRQATTARHMAAGVTIFQPHSVLIDAGVEIGPDTVIEPFVQLLGTTRIGSHSRIRSYSVLEDMIVGDHVQIRQGSILESSEVRDGALIGPYAHLRPESLVEEGVHIGNFVELKKTHMRRGAKANHLSYLGDAEIGEASNVGAGTIICNYDGVDKHKTIIGANAFIGSDSVLVAPLTIGDGAYVAAASCITEDVPAEALALGRARQTNKPGWARTRKTRVPLRDNLA